MKTLTTTDIRIGIAVDHCECDIGKVPANRLTDAMSLHMFSTITDPLIGLKALTLQGTGETLLAPNVVEMIRCMKRRGVEVTMETNGTLVYRDRAEELVDARLDRLRVLMDGIGQHGIEDEVTSPRNFGPTLENLAGLTAARRSSWETTPVVEAVFVADQYNVRQLPDIVALLASAQVDEVRVWQKEPVCPETWALMLYRARETADEYWLKMYPPETRAERIDDSPYVGLGHTCEKCN